MLEKLQRLQSASKLASDLPGIKVGSPAAFFDSRLADAACDTRLPTWRGELYFELHRGTYTSQAGLKGGNREMEQLLHVVELYATLASIKNKAYS
ncbi:Glycoside hydrolase, 38 vacuolar alpha mannosidase [Cryptotrichosporon argae]